MVGYRRRTAKSKRKDDPAKNTRATERRWSRHALYGEIPLIRHATVGRDGRTYEWWEYDPTFYLLKALSWLGVVWDLQSPPEAVIRGEQRLGRKVIDKVKDAVKKITD